LLDHRSLLELLGYRVFEHRCDQEHDSKHDLPPDFRTGD